jgi:hypothetical protein
MKATLRSRLPTTRSSSPPFHISSRERTQPFFFFAGVGDGVGGGSARASLRLEAGGSTGCSGRSRQYPDHPACTAPSTCKSTPYGSRRCRQLLCTCNDQPNQPTHCTPLQKLGRASNTASGAGTSYKTSIDNPHPRGVPELQSALAPSHGRVPLSVGA